MVATGGLAVPLLGATPFGYGVAEQFGVLLKYIAKEKPGANIAFFYGDSEFGREPIPAGREMAKTVIVDVDGHLAMAVLPATKHVSTDRLGRSVGAQHVGIAKEGEFRFDFPGCEVGAMPPFGNLYRIPVVVDESLKRMDAYVTDVRNRLKVGLVPPNDVLSAEVGAARAETLLHVH